MANNGYTSNEIAKDMLDAFDLLAKAEVSSAQFDKTVVAIIVSCEDAASGRYRVQYQDSIFNAYSSALDVTYTKGTSVQVRIPNNDFSGRKIIIGTCEDQGIDYGTVVEDPLLRYEFIGGDCIFNSKEEGLCTYWKEEKNNIVLYDRSDNLNKIGLDTQMVWDNIKQGNSVILGATIKTKIDDEQRFSGNYGIKYTLTFEDITNINPTTDRYYIVDIDKMSGDPYSYDLGTDQLVPFDIDSEHFLYISKIELFAKQFPYQNEEKEPDIWISNVRFQCANRIPDEEFNGTGLTIVTPEGNYFRASENLSTKRAIAELRIRGKITGNVRKVEYYWFIEDLRVDRTSNIGYHKYAGRGWRCLNEYNITDADTEIVDGKEVTTNIRKVQYISANDTLQVKQETTKSRETKYKCVAVYNGTVLQKEFIFMNYDVDTLISISCDNSPNFIDSIGKVTMTCLPLDQAEYKWAKESSESGFESVSVTTDINGYYASDVKTRDELQYKIQNKIIADNETNRQLLKAAQDRVDSYNTKTRVLGNQIINLQASSIFQEVIYKCQVFDENGISLGIGSQLVTNTLRSDDDEQSGHLIIHNGNQVFKYDAKGISPTHSQWEEPQTILPLSFTLRAADGNEIPDTMIKDTDVLWIVSTKDTMIDKVEGVFASQTEDKLRFNSKSEFPLNGDISKLYIATDTQISWRWNGSSYIEVGPYNEDYQFYIGKSLSYTIKENYYSQKDNNEIQLQVKYQGMLYIATTNLFFTKDGEDGTNGTNFVLKIIPQGTVGRLKTVKAGESGPNWYTAQLWSNGILLYQGTKNDNNANIKLIWSMVGDNRSTHNVTVISNGTDEPRWTAAPTTQYSKTATDVVKATLNYNGMTIVATQPIIYAPAYVNNTYDVSLKKGTGFTHVTYSEDGLTPDYDSKIPFELTVKKLIGDKWGDISGHNTLSYKWSCVGNLKIKSGYTNNMSQIMFEPIASFNSEEMGNAVICELWEKLDTGEQSIGIFRIPIHFLLNRYGHSAINEWDGNSIQLDANGNTMLLAPQGGFGKKNEDNSYTGLLMGTVKEYYGDGSDDEFTGMFAYNEGNRTMFLNAETGAANFGQVGSAQIVIDPHGEDKNNKQKHVRIYSGDYYVDYDNKTGLPTAYDESNEPWYKNRKNYKDDAHAQQALGKGMMIDLTEPSITWGNRNFYVTKEGFINARGGGHIAGWNIDNYKIYSDNGGKTGMSSVFGEHAEGVTEWNVYYPGGNINKPIAFWAGGTGTSGKFHVAHDGYVRATELTIGNGDNGTKNLIYIGNNKDATSNSAMFTFNHQTLLSTADGFYMGTDGYSLGSKFKLTPQGILYIGDNAVKNGGNENESNKFWTINGNGSNSYISYNKNGNLTSTNKGVYIGTDGFSLGSKFKLTNNGVMYIGTNATANGGNEGESQKFWTIDGGSESYIRYNKTNLTTGSSGVYIGTDGISLGSAYTYNNTNIPNLTKNTGQYCRFTVKKDGTLYAQDAIIAGTIYSKEGQIGGWEIRDSKIEKDNGNGEGIEISSTGYIKSKNGKWEIKKNGDCYFRQGDIASWKIENDKLSSSGIEIKSNGEIRGGSTNGWWIKGDGSASFAGGKLTISSGGNLTISTNNFTFNAADATQTIGELEGKIITLTGQIQAANAVIKGKIDADDDITTSGTVQGKYKSSDGTSGVSEDFDIVTWVGNLSAYISVSVYQASADHDAEGGWATAFYSGFNNEVKIKFQVNRNHLTFKDGLLTEKKDIASGAPETTATSKGVDTKKGTSWTNAPAWSKSEGANAT